MVLYTNTLPRGHRHVALKIHKREGVDQDEIEAYEQPSKGNRSHPGYQHIRAALASFTIDHPQGSTIVWFKG